MFLGVAAGVTTTVALATAVNDYTGSVGTCPIGSNIKSIYIEASYSNDVATSGRLDWLLVKDPSGLGISIVPGSTGGDPQRKWVFHESKGNNPVESGGGLSKKSGWIRVPPKMQRMGEDDVLQLKVGSSTTYNFCLKCIYKWYA